MSFRLESFDFMGLLPSSKEIPDRRKNKYLMNARKEERKRRRYINRKRGRGSGDRQWVLKSKNGREEGRKGGREGEGNQVLR